MLFSIYFDDYQSTKYERKLQTQIDPEILLKTYASN